MTRKPYPTDLTDGQWALVGPLLPLAKTGGRPRSVDMREVVNGILYVNRTGCAWRALPHDLTLSGVEGPPWGTTHFYYRQFRIGGVWGEVHDRLRADVRVAAGREPTPSAAAVIDSQSVKTTEKGGYTGNDAGKKVNGRKRHVVVDTMGLIIAIVVHAGNVQDRDGARLVMAKLPGAFPRLKLIWADGGYAGKLIEWVSAFAGWTLEIVRRTADLAGFKLLPHRWVVERALSEAEGSGGSGGTGGTARTTST